MRDTFCASLVLCALCSQVAGVTLDKMNAGLEFPPTALPIGYDSLLLSGNRIHTLRRGAFSSRSYLALRTLSLSNNGLTVVDGGAFSGGLGQLRTLDLSGNKLTYLGTSAFAGLIALRSLNLAFNTLRAVGLRCFSPAALPALVALDIGFNPMTRRLAREAEGGDGQGYAPGYAPCPPRTFATGVTRGATSWRVCAGAPLVADSTVGSTSAGATVGGIGAGISGGSSSSRGRQHTRHCQVADWGAWGPGPVCAVPCGGARRYRSRTVRTPARAGGAACPALREERRCNAAPCPRRLALRRLWSTASVGGAPVVALHGLQGPRWRWQLPNRGGGGVLLVVLRDRLALMNVSAAAFPFHGDRDVSPSLQASGGARTLMKANNMGYAGIGAAVVRSSYDFTAASASAPASTPTPMPSTRTSQYVFLSAWRAHYSAHALLRVRLVDGKVDGVFDISSVSAVVGRAVGVPFALALDPPDTSNTAATQGGGDRLHLYSALRGFPSMVIKVTAAQRTMKLVDALTLSFGENDVRVLLPLPSSNILLAMTNTAPSRVVRLQTRPKLKRERAVKLMPGESRVLAALVDNSFTATGSNHAGSEAGVQPAVVYAATFTSPAARIVVLDGRALKRRAALTLRASAGEAKAVALAQDSRHVFVATFTQPAVIVRVRKWSPARFMERVDALRLRPTEARLGALVSFPETRSLFGGTWGVGGAERAAAASAGRTRFAGGRLIRAQGWAPRIDCTMAPWGTWSPCDKTCATGGGRQQRARQVLRPAAFGGATCATLSQARSCTSTVSCRHCSGGRVWTMCSGPWFGGRRTCAPPSARAATMQRVTCEPGCTCPSHMPVWSISSNRCIDESECREAIWRTENEKKSHLNEEQNTRDQGSPKWQVCKSIFCRVYGSQIMIRTRSHANGGEATEGRHRCEKETTPAPKVTPLHAEAAATESKLLAVLGMHSPAQQSPPQSCRCMCLINTDNF